MGAAEDHTPPEQLRGGTPAPLQGHSFSDLPLLELHIQAGEILEMDSYPRDPFKEAPLFLLSRLRSPE